MTTNSQKYITVQGDTWDSIAFKLFQDEMFMTQILQANLQYADVLIFPADTELFIPEIKRQITEIKNVPWS